ncbi:MAG: hypothetical protein LBO72_05200 [Helicobacteraceae bacterium]|jgi:hypothetical protein|nr:hypothetical protein [Helicobacteraceae bacterium]
MANTWVICDAGTITCPHGGVVELKSNETMYCIGEKKPLLITDIVGAEIKDCKLPSVAGGPCKLVACANGTDTEDNVMGMDGTFLLRVDGCKTDKGYPLILKDAGQTKWKISAKRVNVVVEIERAETIKAYKGLFIAPVRTVREPLIKDFKRYSLKAALEKEMNGEKGDGAKTSFKPLRAKREFRIVPNYYAMQDAIGKARQYEKVFPYLDARLYVVDRATDTTTEYMILNDGADVGKPMYNAQFGQIRFYNPNAQEKYDFDAIACKADEDRLLVYSPIPIHNADGSLPEALKKRELFDPTKALYVRHSHIIANTSSQSFADETKRANISSSNANEIYEGDESDELYFPVKGENLVLGKYRFFYLSLESLKRDFKNKSLFHALQGVYDYMGYIEDLRYEYELSYFMRHAYCEPFFDELKAKNAYAYSVASIVTRFYTTKEERDAHKEDIKRLKQTYEKIRGFVLNNPLGFSKEVISMLGDDRDLEPLVDLDTANERVAEATFLGAEFIKANDVRISVGANKYYAYRGANGDILRGYASLNYKDNQASPDLVARLLAFSFAFSDRYGDLRSKYPELQTLCDQYDDLANKLASFPRAREEALNAVRNELEFQTAYQDFINAKSKLIQEYESLDATRKLISFDPKITLKFESLSLGAKQSRKPFDDASYGGSPIEKANKLKEALKHTELTFELDYYESLFDVVKEQGEERLFNYAKVMIGTLYNLIAPISDLDEESDLLSPFSDDLANVRRAMTFLHKDIYGYLIQFAPNVTQRLIDLEIYALYNEALFKQIAHAKARKGKYEAGLNEFLKPFKQEASAYAKGEDEYLDKAIKYFTTAREKRNNRYASNSEAAKKRDENRDSFIAEYGAIKKLLGDVKTIAGGAINADEAMKEQSKSQTEAQIKAERTAQRQTQIVTENNAGNGGQGSNTKGGSQGSEEISRTSGSQSAKLRQAIESSKFYQRSLKALRVSFGVTALFNLKNMFDNGSLPKFYQITGALSDSATLSVMIASAMKKTPAFAKGLGFLIPLTYISSALDLTNDNAAYSESYNLARRRFALAQGVLSVGLLCPVPHVRIAVTVLLLASEIGLIISDALTDRESEEVKEAISASVLYDKRSDKRYTILEALPMIFTGRDPNSQGFHAKRFNEIRERFYKYGGYSTLHDKSYANIIHKLAEYYDNARDLYDRAFQYEISRIVSALSDRFAFAGKADETKSLSIGSSLVALNAVYIDYDDILFLTPSLLNSAKRLFINCAIPSEVNEGKYESVYLECAKESKIDQIALIIRSQEFSEYFDKAFSNDEKINLLKRTLNYLYLIVEGADNFAVKYDVTYEFKERQNHPAISSVGASRRFHASITKCEMKPLTQYDIEHINNLNEQERLAKEQEEKERKAHKERKRQREIVIAKQNALFRSLGLKTDENGKIV